MKHTIEKGETLLTIAKKYNTSLSKIIDSNNIKNQNLIFIGQELEIPDYNEEVIDRTKHLDYENLDDKFETFINFLEGRKLLKQLDSIQKDNIKLIMRKCIELHVTDLRMISYILATVFWETNRTFRPIEEYKSGIGKPYGIPHKKTGKIYYGRGFVQLTWFVNYERFTSILYRLGYEIDLVHFPEKATIPEISAIILIVGMRDGKFTGTDLDDHFNPIKSDWYNARRIINGLDKAVIIKSIAEEIYYIIK